MKKKKKVCTKIYIKNIIKFMYPTGVSTHPTRRVTHPPHLHLEEVWTWKTGSLETFKVTFYTQLKWVPNNTYFLGALDMPLPPASSPSETGCTFSFSGFLPGPPKKSPMPFCHFGVGRWHTGFPPAYLFFPETKSCYTESRSQYMVGPIEWGKDTNWTCQWSVYSSITGCGGLRAAAWGIPWTGRAKWLPGCRSSDS